VGHAVEVFLVVLLVALALGLAVVVLLLQHVELGLGLDQLVLQDLAGVGVARLLLLRVDAAGRRSGRHGRTQLGRRDRGGLLRLQRLAALGLGLLGRDRVGEHVVGAAVVD